jgi:hypothetical protein
MFGARRMMHIFIPSGVGKVGKPKSSLQLRLGFISIYKSRLLIFVQPLLVETEFIILGETL